jgi:predicted MFS family arabinose efflux permease
MSIHSLVLMGTKMLAGVIYDKKGLRTMMLMCNSVGVVAMITLAFVAPTPMGMALAMIWGVTSSIALPMETIGVTLVASDLFGNKCFDQMLGIMLALNHAGYAVGSIVVNGLYDLCGNTYFYAILLFAAVLAAVTVMYQFIINAAHKKRKQVEAFAE